MRPIIIIILITASLFAIGQSRTNDTNDIHISGDIPYNDDDFTRPSFPGGLKCFEEYLKNNIRYSENAVKNNTQGKVYLIFTIEKDGSVGHIKVSKGVSRELDDEAVRVLKSSPKWTPGTHHGKPNIVYESIPIKFQLPKNKFK